MNIFELLIVQPIFNLLIGLYSLIPGGDFGVALIIFTVLVRLALWPLLKRQLHQVKAMRKLQPELTRIKRETKGNRQLESVRMMELYKEHNVKPLRSILILLIQLPIFIAIYQVVQIFTLHRNEVSQYTYGFLKGIEPIKELIIHPSSFHEKLFGLVDLTTQAIGPHGVSWVLVLLALIAATSQYFMSRQTQPIASKRRLRDIMKEAAGGKQADQSEMNAAVMSKMTKILPFFMLFIMLNLPGALALYYAVSNLVAMIQQRIILREDETELEAIADRAVARAARKAAKAAKKSGAPTAKVSSVASAKERASHAKKANVTRLTAKDGKK